MAYGISLLAVKLHGKPRLASVKIERNWRKLVNVTKCVVWGLFIRTIYFSSRPRNIRNLLAKILSTSCRNRRNSVYASLLLFIISILVNTLILSLDQSVPLLMQKLQNTAPLVYNSIYIAWWKAILESWFFSLPLTLLGQPTSVTEWWQLDFFNFQVHEKSLSMTFNYWKQLHVCRLFFLFLNLCLTVTVASQQPCT